MPHCSHGNQAQLVYLDPGHLNSGSHILNQSINSSRSNQQNIDGQLMNEVVAAFSGIHLHLSTLRMEK